MVVSFSRATQLSIPTLFHTNTRLFRVSGRDAERYLQGRITQDLKGLKTDEVKGSLVLSPQGRTLGLFYIGRLESDFLIWVDNLEEPTAVQDFVNGLLQFKVADEVVIEELDHGDRLVGLFVEDSTFRQFFPSVTLEFDNQLFRVDLVGESIIGWVRRRFDKCCVELFFESLDSAEAVEAIQKVCGQCGVDQIGIIGEAELERLRIQAGELRWGIDVTENTLAPQVNLSKWASFSKGCYAGQEVVEMATARGKPNKAFVLLSSSSKPQLNTGLEVCLASSEGATGELVGAVTSFTESDSATHCICSVKWSAHLAQSFRIAGAEFSNVKSYL